MIALGAASILGIIPISSWIMLGCAALIGSFLALSRHRIPPKYLQDQEVWWMHGCHRQHGVVVGLGGINEKEPYVFVKNPDEPSPDTVRLDDLRFPLKTRLKYSWRSW